VFHGCASWPGKRPRRLRSQDEIVS
jgi:hypothetical protein